MSPPWSTFLARRPCPPLGSLHRHSFYPGTQTFGAIKRIYDQHIWILLPPYQEVLPLSSCSSGFVHQARSSYIQETQLQITIKKLLLKENLSLIIGWPWKEGLSLGIVGSLWGQILPADWPNRWEVGDLALMKRRNCTTLLNTWVQNYFMGEWCKVLIFTAFIGGGLGSWKSNTTGSFSSFGTESELSNCKNEFFHFKMFLTTSFISCADPW